MSTSSATMDSALAQSMSQQNDASANSRKMEQLRREMAATPDKDKEAKLRKACEGFESVFIQKMWEQMQSSIPKEGYLHSKEEKFWQGMYDQELSKKMTSAGGIGLTDMMMVQLSKNIQSGTGSGLNRREPMSIEPAPLLPKTGDVVDKLASVDKLDPQAKPSDLYSGAAPQVALQVDQEEAEQAAVAQAQAVAQAPAEAQPDEFGLLLSKLETEMNAPQVVVTTTVIQQPNAPKPGSKHKIPRISADHPITGRTVRSQTQMQSSSPSLSPTNVSHTKTAALNN